MLMSIRNFLLKGGVTVLATVLYACHSISTDKFEPPPKKQIEKQYIIEAKQSPGKTNNKFHSPEPAETHFFLSSPRTKYRNINEVVLNGVDGNGFLTNVNFVTRWNILGPFFYKAEKLAGNKIKSVLHDSLLADEKKLTGGEKAAAPAKWQLVRFESPRKPGEINLRNLFKDKRKYLIAYAVTYLRSAEALSNLTLYTGSSGYIKVWINYQLVHAYDHTKRQGKWDQDAVRNIKLKKGYNLIVVKCVALESSWNFYLRLADASNSPLKFLPVKAAKPKLK